MKTLFTLTLLVIASTHHAIAQNKKLVYTDINNNRYIVTETSVEYIPITAAESSSGMYNGGEAWKKKIDNEVFFVIEEYFSSISTKKENLLKTRIKPSIVLSVKQGKKKEKIYMCKPNQEFDEYMKSLKTNKTVMD